MEAAPCDLRHTERQLISVIVPVYNVELYLPACIDSIVRQTYQNLEIILVDDGSTDRSGSICDQYQKTDSRIRVIHKENGGPSSARKVGICEAAGDFVGFVDSDDWIDEDMYQALMDAMLVESADLAASGIFYESDNYTELRYDEIGAGVYRNHQLAELQRKMLYANHYQAHGMIWSLNTKLYKKRYIWPLLAEEDEVLRHGEDVACNCAYVCESKCVVILDQAFYHYRQRSGSIVHSKNPHYLENLNLLYKYFQGMAKKGGYEPEAVSKFNYFIFDQCLQMPQYMFDNPREVPIYGFPFDRIPVNSRLILYGAGMIGKSYYNLVQWTNAYQVVGWIDQNYQKLQMENVRGTDILKETTYDYIVIAVKIEKTAQQIKDYLMSLNVPKEKLLWFEPKHLFEVMFQ